MTTVARAVLEVFGRAGVTTAVRAPRRPQPAVLAGRGSRHPRAGAGPPRADHGVRRRRARPRHRWPRRRPDHHRAGCRERRRRLRRGGVVRQSRRARGERDLDSRSPGPGCMRGVAARVPRPGRALRAAGQGGVPSAHRRRRRAGCGRGRRGRDDAGRAGRCTSTSPPMCWTSRPSSARPRGARRAGDRTASPWPARSPRSSAAPRSRHLGRWGRGPVRGRQPSSPRSPTCSAPRWSRRSPAAACCHPTTRGWSASRRTSRRWRRTSGRPTSCSRSARRSTAR